MKKILLVLTVLTTTSAFAKECYVGLDPSTAVVISKKNSDHTKPATRVQLILKKTANGTSLDFKLKPKNSIGSIRARAINTESDEVNRFGIECDGGGVMLSQKIENGETLLVVNSSGAKFSTSMVLGCGNRSVSFNDLVLKKVECAK